MKVLCFGVAKDIVGGSELKIEGQHAQNVSELKKYLNETYPKFLEYKSYMVAVNQSYATDDITISDSDEIALIPPVSGG